MAVLHLFKNPPPAVNSTKTGRLISTGALNAEQKRDLWQGIKQTEPALADMLKNDPMLEQIKTTFDGTIQFSETDARRYIAAGQSHRGDHHENR